MTLTNAEIEQLKRDFKSADEANGVCTVLWHQPKMVVDLCEEVLRHRKALSENAETVIQAHVAIAKISYAARRMLDAK